MSVTPDDALVSQDDKIAGKWRKYLQFKQAIYYAYVSVWSYTTWEKDQDWEIREQYSVLAL